MALTSEAVAIYWDFENLHASLVDQRRGKGYYISNCFRPQDEVINVATIVEFALSLGPLVINRAFANWVFFNRYKMPLLQWAFDLIQVFPPGANAKNGADIKLCIDVIEDMVRFPHIRTIIVVGGDSDYIPLSHKVKATGRSLIGIGSQQSTNKHWARSCHEFKFYEALLSSAPLSNQLELQPIQQPAAPALILETPLVNELGAADEPEHTAQNEDEELRELLNVAFDAQAKKSEARELVVKAIGKLAQARGSTWIQKARLRPFIQRIDSTFHESNFGFDSFNEMLASMEDLVETRKGEHDHELRLKTSLQ